MVAHHSNCLKSKGRIAEILRSPRSEVPGSYCEGLSGSECAESAESLRLNEYVSGSGHVRTSVLMDLVGESCPVRCSEPGGWSPERGQPLWPAAGLCPPALGSLKHR